MPVFETIMFEKIEESTWRAYIKDSKHLGGCGSTPEEALGFLVFNNPQILNIDCFTWLSIRPPCGTRKEYPSGKQDY